MARAVVHIDWSDLTEAAPAFLTIALMPATFSISHGLAAGFLSHAGMKLAAGRAGEAHWLGYAIAFSSGATSGSSDRSGSSRSPA